MQGIPQTILWHSCMEEVYVQPSFLFSYLRKLNLHIHNPCTGTKFTLFLLKATGFVPPHQLASAANSMRTQEPNSKAVIFKLAVKELPCATHIHYFDGIFQNHHIWPRMSPTCHIWSRWSLSCKPITNSPCISIIATDWINSLKVEYEWSVSPGWFRYILPGLLVLAFQLPALGDWMFKETQMVPLHSNVIRRKSASEKGSCRATR